METLWPEIDDTTGSASQVVYGDDSTSNTVDWNWYPSSVYWYSYLQKVKLSLDDVQFLRSKAKKDKRLQTLLNRFAHLVELEIDF